MSGVHIDITGLDELIADLDELANAPGPRTAARLDAILTEGFEETQAAIHVERGVTKATGVHYATTTPGNWTGTIEYGDPTGGEHETGAAWLLRDSKQHPDRDYLAPLDDLAPQITDAIDDYFRGD